MRLLADTQIVYWFFHEPEKLPPAARKYLDAASAVYVSAASIWEIAIKRAQRRPDFLYDPRVIRRRLIDDGYEELAVLGRHVVEVDSLPPIHKDPFDRILIAQATVEGITLLTADPVIARYPGPIRKV